MNPDILNAEIKGRFAAGFGALFAALVLMGSGAFFMHVYHTSLKPLPKGPPDLVCYEMAQLDIKRHGWKRVPEVDRQRISDMVMRGKAQWREERSLKCRQYTGGEIGETLAKEQWWREKR